MYTTQQIRLIGQPVRSLQTMLRALSFAYDFLPRLTPDGIFGERTLEAVMLFQREFHPPVTGRVNQSTWDAIANLYRLGVAAGTWSTGGFPAGGITVAPGSSSVHINVLQSMFRALAQVLEEVEEGAVTGVNDPVTARNIRWLQRIANRPETGILDQSTWNLAARLYTIFVTLAQA